MSSGEEWQIEDRRLNRRTAILVRREAQRHAALLNGGHTQTHRGTPHAGDGTGRSLLRPEFESGVDAPLCHRTPKDVREVHSSGELKDSFPC